MPEASEHRALGSALLQRVGSTPGAAASGTCKPSGSSGAGSCLSAHGGDGQRQGHLQGHVLGAGGGRSCVLGSQHATSPAASRLWPPARRGAHFLRVSRPPPLTLMLLCYVSRPGPVARPPALCLCWRCWGESSQMGASLCWAPRSRQGGTPPSPRGHSPPACTGLSGPLALALAHCRHAPCSPLGHCCTRPPGR